MKSNLTLVTPERQAELKESLNLIAEKKRDLRKKEVYKVMRALGMVRAPPAAARQKKIERDGGRPSRVGADGARVEGDVAEDGARPR